MLDEGEWLARWADVFSGAMELLRAMEPGEPRYGRADEGVAKWAPNTENTALPECDQRGEPFGKERWQKELAVPPEKVHST